jgi:uncharacterized repeat protein (TIGR01451 family)
MTYSIGGVYQSSGTFSGLVPGPYTVTAMNSDGCISVGTIITINAQPLTPVVTTTNTAIICSGTSPNIILTASVASSFTWSVGTITGGITGASAGSGATINQTLTNPTNTTEGNVEYIVTPTSVADLCVGSAYTIIVTVNHIPAAVAGADRTIFQNQSTQIGAPAVPGSTYSWSSVPVGFISTEANPTVTPLVTTIYTVVETITATGCQNTHSVTVTVTSSADLQIIKTCTTLPVVAGELIHYQLAVHNIGPSAAENVVISDVVPPQITAVEFATNPGGPWSVWGASYNVGTMTPGTDAILYLRGTVNSSMTGSLVNSANVTSSTPDPDLTNNNSTVTSVVTSSADMQITKTDGSATYTPGTTTTYTITVTNNGPSNVTGHQRTGEHAIPEHSHLYGNSDDPVKLHGQPGQHGHGNRTGRRDGQ